MSQFDHALAFYEAFGAGISTAQSNAWPYPIDPSMLTATFAMTPIEQAIWERIRELDAVFYPQYPVDRFFADFANPIARVAIECDGVQFHQDSDRDQARDARFHELGWKVYRIPGRLCVSEADPDDESAIPFSRRFVRAIADRHGLIRSNPIPRPVDETMEECLRYSLAGKLALMGLRY
jgi:hypothetical protein